MNEKKFESHSVVYKTGYQLLLLLEQKKTKTNSNKKLLISQPLIEGVLPLMSLLVHKSPGGTSFFRRTVGDGTVQHGGKKYTKKYY